MATLIKTNSKPTTVKGKGPKGSLTLEQMQKAVGGYVEVVGLMSGRLMLVNEEGLLKNLPYNAVASDMAGRPIVGDVLVADSKEVK